jgi:hypothetical protein
LKSDQPGLGCTEGAECWLGSDSLLRPGTTSINISSSDLKLRESTMYTTSRYSAVAEEAEN